MIGVSYSYFQVNRQAVGVQHCCALMSNVVQIHDFYCNEILFFNDRQFMVWARDVRKAIAIRK
ncbi:hypothetical protein LC608_02820 [Nostoc sp. XA010]|uniref:hypothetical protein n=1 Tax=Nostoc sp. XA010 TaxID=2780407 RepID=UPI001E419D79|nr:hypothetical protein [Nostoc sp. XA010]MCC5655934.1 hypothetical protein [Nostoc sp. XA010]